MVHVVKGFTWVLQSKHQPSGVNTRRRPGQGGQDPVQVTHLLRPLLHSPQTLPTAQIPRAQPGCAPLPRPQGQDTCWGAASGSNPARGLPPRPPHPVAGPFPTRGEGTGARAEAAVETGQAHTGNAASEQSKSPSTYVFAAVLPASGFRG